jgi:hypothetical protein
MTKLRNANTISVVNSEWRRSLESSRRRCKDPIKMNLKGYDNNSSVSIRGRVFFDQMCDYGSFIPSI